MVEGEYGNVVEGGREGENQRFSFTTDAGSSTTTMLAKKKKKMMMMMMMT